MPLLKNWRNTTFITRTLNCNFQIQSKAGLSGEGVHESFIFPLMLSIITFIIRMLRTFFSVKTVWSLPAGVMLHNEVERFYFEDVVETSLKVLLRSSTSPSVSLTFCFKSETSLPRPFILCSNTE